MRCPKTLYYLNAMKNIFWISIWCCFLTGCTVKTVDPLRPLDPPRGFPNETILKVAYGLGMLDLIDTEPEVPQDIEVLENIEYKYVDSISLQLDIYKRKDLRTPAPTIIFIHGGAWRGGKRSDYLPYLIDYAQKGYITATISYRLVKQAVFPAAVQDVYCAIKWIKANSIEYGIDPDRIALLGGSAGGHLSLMVGYCGKDSLFSTDCSSSADHKVKAIIDLYGPVDLTTPYAIGTYQVKDFLNSTYDRDPELFELASPRRYISGDDPPTLIFQGTIDSLVPVSQSDSLERWLQEAGVPYEYHRLEGWPHTMDISTSVNEYCQFYIDRFLKKHL